LPDHEITGIRRASVAKTALPETYLGIGQRVRIQGGLFAGVEGFLLSRKGRDRLVISVDLIQSSFSIELDSSQLELAELTSVSPRYQYGELSPPR
jgi:hypothetical protein